MIRKATLEDVPHLLDLMEQLGYQISLEELHKNALAYLQDFDRALFVAELEGKIVGCLALDMAVTFHRLGKHMRVVSLVVDRSYRRKGIGRRLLEAAEEVARREGCWVVDLTSSTEREKEGVHDFYIKRGYLKNGAQSYFRKMIE